MCTQFFASAPSTFEIVGSSSRMLATFAILRRSAAVVDRTSDTLLILAGKCALKCGVHASRPTRFRYLLRSILMSTWGFLPAVFRPFWTVFPGLGAGFLNLGGKTEATAKKRGKNEKKWARNGLKRVGVS